MRLIQEQSPISLQEQIEKEPGRDKNKLQNTKKLKGHKITRVKTSKKLTVNGLTCASAIEQLQKTARQTKCLVAKMI